MHAFDITLVYLRVCVRLLSSLAPALVFSIIVIVVCMQAAFSTFSFKFESVVTALVSLLDGKDQPEELVLLGIKVRRAHRCVTTCTVVCLSFGPIEKYIMFSVTSTCARRTGAAARVERRRRER